MEISEGLTGGVRRLQERAWRELTALSPAGWTAAMTGSVVRERVLTR